jgi:hypothetical protein
VDGDLPHSAIISRMAVVPKICRMADVGRSHPPLVSRFDDRRLDADHPAGPRGTLQAKPS